MLTYDQAVVQYPGVKIKELDKTYNNSKGFFDPDNTQYVYKSEITGKNKNVSLGFWIYNDLYVLPAPLKMKLQMHFNKEIPSAPDGIEYTEKEQRWKIPRAYLQNMTKQAVPVTKEEKESVVKTSETQQLQTPTVGYVQTDVELTPVTYTTSVSTNYTIGILNKVAMEIERTRVLDSFGFYSSIMDMSTFSEILREKTEDFGTNPTEENLVNLIISSILYKKYNDN